jgi:PIN domain nuclease of toxin-antitoxin system
MSDPTPVLDASALLAMLNDEPGGERVAGMLPHVRISAVNLSEVVAKLAEHGMPEPAIHSALEGLGLEVIDLDRALAYRAGMLRPSTKALGLSLGDRACLALGLQSDAPVVTADRIWSELDLQFNVLVIR